LKIITTVVAVAIVCAFTYFVIHSIIAYVWFLIYIVSFDFMCCIIFLITALL